MEILKKQNPNMNQNDLHSRMRIINNELQRRGQEASLLERKLKQEEERLKQEEELINQPESSDQDFDFDDDIIPFGGR